MKDMTFKRNKSSRFDSYGIWTNCHNDFRRSGADVIKVKPLEGELMRKVGRSINGMTNSFLCCNRSKRSLV